MANDFGIPMYNPIVPQTAYIKVKLGDTIYEAETPNFIKSFNFTKQLKDGRGTFEIVLSDIMDYGLEQKLIDATLNFNGNNFISFQYGHSQGSRSPWYKGIVQEYIPNFLPNMNATFTISGFADISYGKLLNKTYNLKDYDMRISNLIKALCTDEGWKISEPFIVSDKYEKESDIAVYNKTTLEFIVGDLVTKATKNNNRVEFLHYSLSDSVNVRLVEIDLKNPKLSKKEFNFIINSGNYGSVLGFTPTYSGAQNTALKVNAGYVDRETNQFTLFKNNPNLGLNYPNNTQYLGASSVEEFNNVIQTQWVGDILGKATAQLDIVGDPDVYPTDNINIIPMRPDGKIHHSAGTYYVMGVTDTIQGAYKTSLNLLKYPGKERVSIIDAYESGWRQS